MGDSPSLARPPLEPGRAAGILPGSCDGARPCVWRSLGAVTTPAFRKLLCRGFWATLQLPAHKRQNLPHPHHGCSPLVYLLHNLLFPMNLAKGQSACTSLLKNSHNLRAAVSTPRSFLWVPAPHYHLGHGGTGHHTDTLSLPTDPTSIPRNYQMSSSLKQLSEVLACQQKMTFRTASLQTT